MFNRICVIVALALIYPILGVTSANASAFGDCRYRGVANMYATSDENVSLEDLFSTKDEFKDYFCRKDGLRLHMAKADTKSETRQLRTFVRESNGRYANSLMFCDTAGDRSYMIGLDWIFRPMKMSRYENRTYPQWAARWAETHNCFLAKRKVN